MNLYPHFFTFVISLISKQRRELLLRASRHHLLDTAVINCYLVSLPDPRGMGMDYHYQEGAVRVLIVVEIEVVHTVEIHAGKLWSSS